MNRARRLPSDRDSTRRVLWAALFAASCVPHRGGSEAPRTHERTREGGPGAPELEIQVEPSPERTPERPDPRPASEESEPPPPEQPAVSVGARGWALGNGPIFDRETPALYLMNDALKVVALDPRTGRELWVSDVSAKPLAWKDHELLAQIDAPGPTLRFVVLDTRARGRSLRSCDAVTLPPWASASLRDGPSSMFWAASMIRDGTVYVRWQASFQEISGVPTEGRTERGLLEVDLHTGRTRSLAPTTENQRWRDPPPVPWRGTAQGPFALEEVESTIESERDSSGRTTVTLTRRRRDEGASLPPVILGRQRAPSPSLFVRFSVDRTHVLLAERDLSRRGVTAFEWSVFSMATAERVGHFAEGTPDAPFLVWRGLLLKAAGAISVLRLPSGRSIWQRSLPDTRFHHVGPLPG